MKLRDESEEASSCGWTMACPVISYAGVTSTRPCVIWSEWIAIGKRVQSHARPGKLTCTAQRIGLCRMQGHRHNLALGEQYMATHLYGRLPMPMSG